MTKVIPHAGGVTKVRPGGSTTTSWAPQPRPGGESNFFDMAGSMYSAAGGVDAARAGALSSGVQGLAGAYGSLGGSMANAAGQHSGALANLGGSMANNYGYYAGAMGSIASALASERAAASAAAAQSESARQLAAGNIANQALASYGSLGNSALSAWLGNQQAYNQARASMGQSAANAFGAMAPAVAGIANSAANAFGSNAQAMSAMQGANQQATSQLGQSRNQALAGLGGSLAQLGSNLGTASQVGDVSLGFGGGGGMGGGFSATGPSGSVASGSYGGMGGMGGMGGSSYRGPGPEFGGVADRSFAGMGGLQRDVMNSSALSQLGRSHSADMRQLGGSYDSARGQIDAGYENLNNSFADTGRRLDEGGRALDSQHASSRSMPMDMFNNSLGGFRQLASDGYGQLGQGMNQFYKNMNASRADFSPMVNNSTAGYISSANDMRNMGNRMSGDFRSGMNQAGSMAGGLLGLGRDLSSGIGNLGTPSGSLLSGIIAKPDTLKTPLERAMAKSAEQDFYRVQSQAARERAQAEYARRNPPPAARPAPARRTR